MTPEGTERVIWLCKQLQNEEDQNKFMELLSELNALLDKSPRHLRPQPSH